MLTLVNIEDNSSARIACSAMECRVDKVTGGEDCGEALGRGSGVGGTLGGI